MGMRLLHVTSEIRGRNQVREKASPSLLELIMSRGVTVDKQDIDRLILECVDEALDSALGKFERREFYDLLERNYYLSRDDIPSRLGDFLLILERNAGANGKAVRQEVAQRLGRKLASEKPYGDSSNP